PELEPPNKMRASQAVRSACKNGVWRSTVAVYVYENEPWTVFDDLTGYLATFTAGQWREFAGPDELVVAGYNDAVPYGQLIVVRSGRVVREFLEDRQDPRQDVNRGSLDSEKARPIHDWVSAAAFADDDKIATLPDEGLLCLLGPRS